MTTAVAQPFDLEAHCAAQRAKIDHARAAARRDSLKARIGEVVFKGGSAAPLRSLLATQENEVSRLAAALPGAKQ